MNKNKSEISRRDFIKNSALGLAAASTPAFLSSCSQSNSQKGIPTRILGKTGLEVSALAFGGGSQFLKNKDGEWEKMLERAIDSGVNFFDTASSYSIKGSIHSEERYGQILPRYRDSVYVCTKFDPRDEDGMMREFEESLNRLKMDYVDVLMIHNVENSEDISAVEKGIYRKMLQLKDAGAARSIGFSSMNSSTKSKEIIEKLNPDVAMLAMNPTQYGDFSRVALPAARQNNVGTIAMKVLRNLVGKNGTTARELMTYALTQSGVACAVIGHVGLEILEENIRLVKEITSPSKTALNFDRSELEGRLADYSGPHALSWARPDYRDGNWA